MATTVSKTFDVLVDVDLSLEDFDEDDLVEEVNRRGLAATMESFVIHFGEQRDIDFLADMIAECRTRDALDQLRRLCPSAPHANAVLTFAAVRKASGATS
ncbi:hypothetical protein [Aureimonas sp. SA4125]|uniref:hypothetical protein n=1 Tax=Aureimonas sp. SA4125 TaxID=2826993 RepID=UPI001CC5681C|nr:hypothetical protein [Aureimonas sp. SA4125]